MEYFNFTETPRFERNAERLIGDDALGKLQIYLCYFPDRGKLISGSGSIRKLRWGIPGHGKRGGTRVIYFIATSRHRILLLDIYAKNEKEDLSRSELKDLENLVKEWLAEI